MRISDLVLEIRRCLFYTIKISHILLLYSVFNFSRTGLGVTELEWEQT